MRAEELAELLSTGVWTHDHALIATDLEKLGLKVGVGVPVEEREHVDLYPPPRGRQASVEYVPSPPVLVPRSRVAGGTR